MLTILILLTILSILTIKFTITYPYTNFDIDALLNIPIMGNSNKHKREKRKQKKIQREEGCASLFTAYPNTFCVDL